MSDTDIVIDPLTILLSRLSRNVLYASERDLLRDLVNKLVTRVTELEAERDRHAATIDRVRQKCDDIVTEVYGQHDEDDDGMREAVARIRTALGDPTCEPAPDPRCGAALRRIHPQQPTTETTP